MTCILCILYCVVLCLHGIHMFSGTKVVPSIVEVLSGARYVYSGLNCWGGVNSHFKHLFRIAFLRPPRTATAPSSPPPPPLPREAL